MPLIFFFLSWLGAQAGTLEMTFLDVGQGDAILVESPEGKTVLIDAGPRKANVLEQLRAHDIEQLNLIIATHAHADHIGGMLDVITGMPPGLYVDQGMAHTSATYDNLMSYIERSGLPYRTARAGQSFNLGEEVLIEIIHPQDALLRNTRSDLNSNSVIVRITHGEVCFLLAGDAEPDTEETLLRKGIGHCQVLKVAHHGSAYSTSDAWLRAVEPELSIVSAGAGNRYGHPDPDTIGRLSHAQVEIYRTDLHGEIQLLSDGKEVRVQTHPKTSQAPVLLTESSSEVLVRAVDINSATAKELEALPGIGEVKAAAIVQWRTANGPFETLNDLDAVPGIGPATLAKLEPVVVFGPTIP